MSLPADDPGMARGRELRTRSLYAQLLHSLLQLKGTMKDLIWLLITKHQDPVPSGQVTKLKHLMYSTTNLLQLRSSSLPPHSLGSQGAVRTDAQDSLMIPLDSLQAAFVSPELSNRGIDITTLFNSSFQDFLSYQADKYQKEKNSLVRKGTPWCGGFFLTEQRRDKNRNKGSDMPKKVGLPCIPHLHMLSKTLTLCLGIPGCSGE